MNKQELLHYLTVKLAIVSPVHWAHQRLAVAQNDYNSNRSFMNIVLGLSFFFGPIMIVLTVLEFIGRIFGKDPSGDLFFGLVSSVIGTAVFYYTWTSRQKKRREIEEAERDLLEKTSRPQYKAGINGFPPAFYNYNDIDYLRGLVQSGRADTLKEAFSLLENKKHHDTMISIQQETRAYAESAAASAAQAAYHSRRD